MSHVWCFLCVSGVVGAVDGCHISIKAPEERQADYLNRKMFHSIVLQGIPNAKRQFTNVYIGSPGSMHDARILQNSQIFIVAETARQRLFQPNQHIVGDSAYPLKNWLMSPYRDTGHLSHTEKRFNKRLSQSRVVIEHAFGALKTRFRRLLYTVDADPVNVCNIVHACCVLHNICQADADEDDNTDVNTPDDISLADVHPLASTIDEDAKLKRKRIADLLML